MMLICKERGDGIHTRGNAETTEQPESFYKRLCRDLNVATIFDIMSIKMQLEYNSELN